MNLNGTFSPMQISASGLAAERLRMEVVANNIANAQSTQSLNGGPFRRQQVVFSEMHQRTLFGMPSSRAMFHGVRVAGIQSDTSEFPKVYDPGHTEADAEGFVRMPNVKLPNELVDLVTASRAYEANLKALSTYRDMMEQTLSLLRGIS